MEQQIISRALARLRAAANDTRVAWPTLRWVNVAGPGPEALDLDGSGVFAGLALEPGRNLELRCSLSLPAEVAGVPLAGDALELTVFSLYPIALSWNDRPIFADASVPVAAGPALVQVIPELRMGDNGELHAQVYVPPNQTTSWLHLRFSTPGLRARFELLDVAWAQLALGLM